MRLPISSSHHLPIMFKPFSNPHSEFEMVLDVDLERKRISLSMKAAQPQPDRVSKGEERKKGDRKKEEKRQERKQKQKSTFTNNPFSDAFRNKN